MAEEKMVDQESVDEETVEETVENDEEKEDVTVEEQLKALEEEVNTWKIKYLRIWKILKRDYKMNMQIQ